MCATRPKNENESKNEKHGDKSECVYDNVKIKIESTKVVNTRLVCRVCKCVGVVVRTCETCMGVTTRAYRFDFAPRRQPRARSM